MHPIISDPVIRNVRVVLAERGLNQRHIAEILGITRQAVSRRLTGAVPFRADELVALAKAWGIPVSRFYAPEPNGDQAA